MTRQPDPFRAALIGFLFTGCLSGCADLPPYYQSLQKQTQTELPDPTTETVYYVTDRQLDSGQFGVTPGAMSYGDCNVSVPAVHDVGNDVLTEQLSQALTHTKVGVFQVSSIAHVLTTPEDFFAQYKDSKDLDGTHDVLVLVHGYNTDFDGAVTTVGELAQDLGGGMTPIAFTWASQGTYQGYTKDEDNVEGATRDLATFLRKLAAQVPPNKIHLIAHSMGARVVAGALEQLLHDPAPVLSKGTAGDQSKRLADLVFAAADMNTLDFKYQLQTDDLAELARRTTIYCSYEDRALQASYYFHGAGTPRAGEAGAQIVTVNNAETIDASLNDLSLVGHGYLNDDRAVIEDLYMLLVLNQPAAKRNLYHATVNGQIYWLIRP